MADDVNRADGYVDCKMKDAVVDSRGRRNQSVFYETQELTGADLDNDLKSIGHPTSAQNYSSGYKEDTVLMSAQQQRSVTLAKSFQATLL